MTRVYQMTEATDVNVDDRFYIVRNPLTTPLNRYIDIATLDTRWAAATGEFDVDAQSLGASVGAVLTLVPAHKITLTAGGTHTITFPTPTKAGFAFLLYVTGAFSFTLPAAVKWANATPPTYTSPSMYSAATFDTGTTWVMSQIASAIG